MDITFVANDTRGGVEPYLALAGEAAARGHMVRAVAPPQYDPDFRAIGARFIPLQGAEQAQAIAAQGRISLREMGRRVVDLTGRWAVDAAEGARGTDLVVSGVGGLSIAGSVAEAVGAGLLRAHLQPLDAPSTLYPGPLAPGLARFGPTGRRLSHTVTAAGISLLSRAPERAARASLRLPGNPGAPLPTIVYGFSSTVVPVESDVDTIRISTGYWTTPTLAATDPRLRDFLNQPGPTVSVGFGSMVTADPQALRDIVIGAARRAGTRIVMLTGWGALETSEDLGEDVLALPTAPHSWLFPRVAATVHHGGAGTTGAALTAGKPTVIVPFGADQPFWAARAYQLGVSPAPLPRTRLTEKALTAALKRALTDTAMRQRADALGNRLRHDHGTASALDIFESL